MILKFSLLIFQYQATILKYLRPCFYIKESICEIKLLHCKFLCNQITMCDYRHSTNENLEINVRNIIWNLQLLKIRSYTLYHREFSTDSYIYDSQYIMWKEGTDLARNISGSRAGTFPLECGCFPRTFHLMCEDTNSTHFCYWRFVLLGTNKM